MRLLPSAALLLGCLFVSCAPAPLAFDPARPPAPEALGPNPAQTEWWYVSGVLPESGLAFHWAQFKVNYRGLPYYASHVAVTDLRDGRLSFTENDVQTARFGFPPLSVIQGDWKLEGQGDGYRLTAGPMDLILTPQRAPVVHPPGYSGTPEVGQLYYQSITRLTVSGTVTVAGQPREARGTVWLDHQWGDQIPGRRALWDWFGLHLSDGSDLMLYRVRDAGGKVVQVVGSRVGRDGVAREVPGLVMRPGRVWRGPSGREYALEWSVQAPGLELSLSPLRDDQELLSRTTSVAYWEGPVRGAGTVDGVPVTASGMGEFVGGLLSLSEGGRSPTPPPKP